MRAVGDAAEVSPVTSSMGRLLDAVGALCGLGAEITYEGQAAIALEAAAWQAGAPGAGARARGDRTYEIALAGDGDGDPLVLDPRAMIRELAVELERGDDVGPIAAGVHEAVSAVTAAAVTRIAARRDLATAVLSGGVFQNRWLIESVAARLADAGLRVLVPERLPPNDGGISFGQAAIAAARPGAGA
jgi:hydrogenase maturation protein HypF